MGSLSFGHLMLVVVAFLLVFGAGRLPRIMGDLAKGLRAFKEGMAEEETKTEEAQAKPQAKPSQVKNQVKPQAKTQAKKKTLTSLPSKEDLPHV